MSNLGTKNNSALTAEADRQTANAPLLTVICISYNHEKFIRDALDSFVTQKTNFRFEVLISDDASTDKTQKIIREYEENYGDIVKPIYHKTNIGAMKHGLCTSLRVSSKYVVYNEGDDYFSSPYKLQRQVDYLEAHPECSICFHPVTVRYQDGSKPDEIFPLPEQRFNKTLLSLEDLLKHNFMQTNSVMYRWRFVTENISKVFPVTILPGDWYLHLLHAQKGAIGFIDENMAIYRRHPGSLWWDSQTPEKLFSRYCLEMYNFYHEVYSNIAIEPEAYRENTLIPAFNTIILSLQKCDNKKGLTGIFKHYPDFVSERYQKITEQNQALAEQLRETAELYQKTSEEYRILAEQHDQLSAHCQYMTDLYHTTLHNSIEYRIKQKLKSYKIVRLIYYPLKKILAKIRSRHQSTS